jgi:hypothetical protein
MLPTYFNHYFSSTHPELIADALDIHTKGSYQSSGQQVQTQQPQMEIDFMSTSMPLRIPDVPLDVM